MKIFLELDALVCFMISRHICRYNASVDSMISVVECSIVLGDLVRSESEPFFLHNGCVGVDDAADCDDVARRCDVVDVVGSVADDDVPVSLLILQQSMPRRQRQRRRKSSINQKNIGYIL